MIPKNLRYATSHEWAGLEGDTCTVGITGFAVEQLTDVVFVELDKVGTKIKAFDDVGHGVPRGEHQDGRSHFLRAQALGQFIPVELGHHHIENDHVKIVGLREREAVGTVVGTRGRVALLHQSLAEQVGHARFVFDD